MCPVLDQWANVLVANEKWEQALSILEKSDQQLATLLEEFPTVASFGAAIIKNGLIRRDVLGAMGNHQAAEMELNRLVQSVEKSKLQAGFFEAILDLKLQRKLPEQIELVFNH